MYESGTRTVAAAGMEYGKSPAILRQQEDRRTISAALDTLQSRTATLHENLNQLENRLDVVSAPHPPTATAATPPPQTPIPIESAIARAIREQIERVDYATVRVLALLDRLEL